MYVGDEMERFVVCTEPGVNISLPIFRLAFPNFTDSFMNSVDLQPKLISVWISCLILILILLLSMFN